MAIVPLFVAVPLAAAFFIPMVSRRFRWFPDFLGNLTTFALLVMSLSAIGKADVYRMGGWPPPIGINLVLDGLSGLMLIVISLVSFMATLFSVRYMEQYTSKLRYYSLFLLMVAGMNGVVLSGDMFNIFVFIEIASIASYALVGFGCEREELEASFKYLVLGSVASTLILFAVAVIYGSLGSLNMAHISRLVAAQGMNKALYFSLALLVMGFSLKAALVPFHAWLPDAHPSAPAPISAMLSGVLIKILGVYALLRISFNVFGMSLLLANILIWLGTISMVVGGLLALGQWDYKRLLAYSSISQVGYVILAVGIGGAVISRGGSMTLAGLAIGAGFFHLINHAVFKSLLFLSSGAIVYSTGTRDLKKMGGLKERMPITAGAANIGAFSISGIPPLNGFWSKLLIIIAAVQARYYWLALIAVVISIVTLAYYLKLQRHAFFGQISETVKNAREVPALMCIPMVLLAILCVGMGLLLLPGPRTEILQPAVQALTLGTKYASLILGQ